MGRLALASVVVQVLAYIIDFGASVLVVVVVFVFVTGILVFLEARGNALPLGKGLLEEMVAEVEGGTIVILQVGGDIGTLIELGAILISKETNLDTAAARSADGAGIVGLVAIGILVVELLALDVLTGIDVAIGFHVVNALTVVIARGGVDIGTLVGIVIIGIITIGIVTIGSVGGSLHTLVAQLAVLLLLLQLRLEGVSKVAVHVDNVLAVVVVASTAAIVGAHAEDDKLLGGQDEVGMLSILIVVIVVITSVGILLDELTLFELDRVAGKINLLGLIVVVLELTEGGGAQHELGVHLGLGGVAADLGCEGVGGGGGDGGRGGEEGKRELHG